MDIIQRDMPTPYQSLYTHGFCRVAVATPTVNLAAPARNAAQTADLAAEASEQHASLVIFPELGLTGYSNDDLFFQDALLNAAESAFAMLVETSRSLNPIIVVGLPLRRHGQLFNCAAVIYRGQVYGVIPKSYLPQYREFYEGRQFRAAEHARFSSIRICQGDALFGSDLLFDAPGCPGLIFHVEICEDVWVPIPPSSRAALAGATVFANLSASNITLGKADYRRLLCASQSGRCIGAYLYSGAGFGESTNDLAWDGHALIYENAELLAENHRFSGEPQLITADIDLDRLAQERSRTTSFADCARTLTASDHPWREIVVPLEITSSVVPLRRHIDCYPYVPADPHQRTERCAEVYQILVQGLAQRLDATRIEHVVIGVSGGLDSALALLVAVGACHRLALPRTNIHAYSLPGFATSEATRGRAQRLMKTLAVSACEIDIRPAAQQKLADINHPFSHGQAVYDTVFENVQAGERAALLFRLANSLRGLVLGTSDLSELALGYTTYGVGDQMAHYSVNSSVPKTLVRHLVQWIIETHVLEDDARAVLASILAAPPSAELVPQQNSELQKAEAEVGPYALQDFNLYYFSRYGYRPSKIAFLAEQAWSAHDLANPDLPAFERREIKHWLAIFLKRFFSNQFKRSALPNGPKVGSGGSLSPRGDWRAPSDVDPGIWLEELQRNVPEQ